MKVYGFTYIRGGESLGYPYMEAFKCLSEFCDHVYVAVGEAPDETRNKVASLPNVTIIDTVWDEAMRKHGHIFAQQANIALDAVRADHKEGWALHLQADQIICKDDFETLKKDFQRAEEEGCDGLSLRFIHFWHHVRQIVYKKRWFPNTIAGVKVNSKGRSVGDSQSLGDCQKVYASDVTVYHYSHALGEQFKMVKRRALSRWWHPDENIDKDLAKIERKFANELVTPYLGKHPLWVHQRFPVKLEKVDSCWIVGDHPALKSFLPRIGAQKVNVVPSLSDVPGSERKKAVILNPNLWQKFFYPTHVPMGMMWENAPPWTFDFRLILLLSEKGVPTDIGGG